MSNRILSVGFFLFLMISSLMSGHHSYCRAKDVVADDLTRALVLTLAEKSDDIITPDTVRVYKQMCLSTDGLVLFAVADKDFCNHLQNEQLRQNAFISLSMIDERYKDECINGGAVYSDTMVVRKENTQFALKAYADLPMAALFRMSDQRMSLTLALVAFLWAIFSWRYIGCQREPSGTISFGGLVYSEIDDCFYDVHDTPIHFTPMQQQLMLLFWNTPSHTLSKEDICLALWPKKEDASDTLYTLIRRLKPVIEESTNLKIVVNRGKSYSLKIR